MLASKKRLIDKEYMGEIFKVLIITNKNNKDFIFDNMLEYEIAPKFESFTHGFLKEKEVFLKAYIIH